MKFTVRSTCRPLHPRFFLEVEDLKEVGKLGAHLTKRRIASATDVRGRSKAPLTAAYAQRKTKDWAGKPIRDLWRSGKFLGQLRYWGATRQQVKVGWTSEYGKLLASVHDEPQGLDALDRREVAALLQRRLAQRVGAIQLWRSR